MKVVMKLNKELKPFTYYLKTEVFYSFLVSALFFLLPASFIIILAFQTMFLLIPQSSIIMTVVWILLETITYFASRILIQTLKNYKDYENFDYKLLFILNFSILSFIITIACAVIALAV